MRQGDTLRYGLLPLLRQPLDPGGGGPGSRLDALPRLRDALRLRGQVLRQMRSPAPAGLPGHPAFFQALERGLFPSTFPHRNMPEEDLSYLAPIRSKILPASSLLRPYSAFSSLNHSGPCPRASTAASCMGRNIPESIWLFTFSISATTSGAAATIPILQPDML